MVVSSILNTIANNAYNKATKSSKTQELLNKNKSLNTDELYEMKNATEYETNSLHYNVNCVFYTAPKQNMDKQQQRLMNILKIPVIAKTTMIGHCTYTDEPVALHGHSRVTQFMSAEPRRIRIEGIISEEMFSKQGYQYQAFKKTNKKIEEVKKNSIVNSISKRLGSLAKTQAKKAMNVAINNLTMPIDNAVNKYIGKAKIAVLQSSKSVNNATKTFSWLGTGDAISGAYSTGVTDTISALQKQAEQEVSDLINSAEIKKYQSMLEAGVNKRIVEDEKIRAGLSNLQQSKEAQEAIDEIKSYTNLSKQQIFQTMFDNLMRNGNLFQVVVTGIVYDNCVIEDFVITSEETQRNAIHIKVDFKQLQIVFQKNTGVSETTHTIEQSDNGQVSINQKKITI